MPVKDIKAHVAFMVELNRELAASGELVDAQGLAFPDQAKIVSARPNGAPAVTDGPFPGGEGVPRRLLDRRRREPRRAPSRSPPGCRPRRAATACP